jgi:hypothetical protein
MASTGFRSRFLVNLPKSLLVAISSFLSIQPAFAKVDVGVLFA